MPKEDDEMEFASKEDLEEITNNPALQKIYNAMKAGVTKKFQSWANERKQLADTLSNYENLLKQWEEWRPYLEDLQTGEPTYDPYEEDRGRQPAYRDTYRRAEDRRTRTPSSDEESTIDSFKSFRDEVLKAGRGFEERLNTMQRMMDLSLQLEDLRRNHHDTYPDVKFDAQKILSTALEKNYPTLEDAYRSVYRDDFIKKDVEKQLSTRLTEEKAKMMAPGETGGGITSTHFKPPDDVPKTFSDASKSILDEIRAGTLTKET